MSLFEELKRRNVIRVAVAYGVVSWFLLQLADLVLQNIHAPEWVMQAIMLVLALGFPLVVIFAWAFEMTPEGLKRERDVDRTQSIARVTGRKLDRMIIGVLVLIVAYLLTDKVVLNHSPQPAAPATAATATNPQPAGKAQPAAAGTAAKSTAPAAAVEDQNAIAVLPFANRSNEQDDLYFTDGIHDDLLTQLARIKNLKVISRTSVMQYRNTQKSIPEIARELHVGKILEGGVQRAGKRVRINAQLIDVSTDEHLWAQTFDREMTVENIFDIQSDITRHIVEAVRGTLTDSEESDLQQLPTTNLQAYEAWLKARIALNRPEYSADKYIEAEKWLKKAVELDPQFAQAWAQLVVTNGQAIWIGYDDTPERLAAMRNALDQARKTGPDLPETLAAEAEYLYRIDTDFHAAEPLFAKASEARPGDADLLIRLAMTERRTAHFEDAIAHIEKAAELDPANTYARALEAETLAIMKDWQRLEPLLAQWRKQFPEVEAFSAYQVWAEVFAHGDLAGARQILDTLKPSLAPAYQNIAFVVPLFERDYQGLIDHWNEPPLVQLRDNPSLSAIWLEQIARAYKYMGDETNCRVFADRAIEAGKKYTSPSVNSAAFILNALAQAYADNGQYDLALKTIDQARELMPEANDSLEGPLLSVARAKMLGLAGQREAALMEIKRLLHTPGGPTVWGLRLNPDWDYFRDDPEFQKLSGKAGQQEEPSS